MSNANELKQMSKKLFTVSELFSAIRNLDDEAYSYLFDSAGSIVAEIVDRLDDFSKEGE